jgi:nicotinate-nucleotide adenylyltransferase
MMTHRLALFGGTFDPIHRGHVAVAQSAGEQIGADRVIFIPARCSPLKGFFPLASDEDRLAMIRLAMQGHATFDVSDWELQRAAPSYTLDTVRHFQSLYGAQTQLHWLIGADAVNDLMHWYKIDELVDACHLTIMYRGGYDVPAFEKYIALWSPEKIEKLRENVVQTPSIDISSTEVRSRLSAGEDVRDLLHPDVIEYIRKHRLYRRD